MKWRRLLLAVLAAACFAGSFRPLAWDWLAPVGVTLLLLALRGATLRGALAVGVVTGFLFHSAVNYWIATTVFSVRSWFPFALWQAVLVALAAWWGTAVLMTIHVVLFCLATAMLPRTLPPRLRPWVIACLWTATEFTRTFGPLGYTWGDLGYAFWRRIPLIQVAEFGAQYAVSFLVALLGAALAEAFRSGRMDRAALLRQWPVAGALLLALAFGYWRIESFPAAGDSSLPVAILQGNVPNAIKFNNENIATTLGRYRQLALSAAGARVMVWPETALPYVLADARVSLGLAEIARQSRAWQIVGVFTGDGVKTMHNSAVVVTPDGAFGDEHCKERLVPFGEYTPLRRELPFINVFAFRKPDFSPCGRLTPVAAGPARVAVSICFESMFPAISRRTVARGANLVAIITNDDWYRNSIAPHEHEAMAAFRAVETRRDVVRAANTGVSCFVDSWGRIGPSLGIGRTGALRKTVELRSCRTFYTRYGDLFPWLCIVVSLTALLMRRRVDVVPSPD